MQVLLLPFQKGPITLIFPEQVAEYNWLKDKMEKAGMHTLIADGESTDQAADFDPYLKPRRLMDVVQPDIRRYGFLDSLAVTRKADQADQLVTEMQALGLVIIE